MPSERVRRALAGWGGNSDVGGRRRKDALRYGHFAIDPVLLIGNDRDTLIMTNGKKAIAFDRGFLLPRQGIPGASITPGAGRGRNL